MAKIEFGCCFCGEKIAEGEGIGVASTDMETGEFVQQWWAHETCFKERLVAEAREAYFEEG